MQSEHAIVRKVYSAKQNLEKAEQLIQDSLPFIRAQASKCISRICTDQDDEYSIALIAFHEAILGYEEGRGAFYSYAALQIRSRIIDFQRKEMRHRGHISLQAQADEDSRTLAEELADSRDHYEELTSLDAVKQEIAELAEQLALFDLSFSDMADNAPRQQRTLAACSAVVRFAAADDALLTQVLKTKKLPIAQLAEGTGVERKTLERHRKYLLAMLIIQTNGFERIRAHLKTMLQGKGGASI